MSEASQLTDLLLQYFLIKNGKSSHKRASQIQQHQDAVCLFFILIHTVGFKTFISLGINPFGT